MLVVQAVKKRTTALGVSDGQSVAKTKMIDDDDPKARESTLHASKGLTRYWRKKSFPTEETRGGCRSQDLVTALELETSAVQLRRK